MTTTDPIADKLMHEFVEASAVFMHRATVKTGKPPERWFEWLMISLYASTSARLLAALETHAPDEVDAVAAELAELMDGEALFDWVGDEANRRGIDLDAVVRQAEERRLAHLARTREETTR